MPGVYGRPAYPDAQEARRGPPRHPGVEVRRRARRQRPFPPGARRRPPPMAGTRPSFSEPTVRNISSHCGVIRLMRRLLQGHLDQRTPGEAAGPVEGADDVGRSQRRLAGTPPGDDLRDGAGCAPGWVALVDGAETQLDLRERRRRPYGVVIDLIHVAEYVCKAVPVFHRHRRHRRGVRYLVRDGMEFTGARWCYTVPLFHPCAGPDPSGGQLGWSRGGLKLRATKPAATSMRTGTPRRGNTSGTTPSDTLME